MSDHPKMQNPLETIGRKVLQSFGPTYNPHSKIGNIDLQKIERISRLNIIKAGIAGAISAALCGYAFILANKLFPETTRSENNQLAYYWATFGGITAIVVIIEILYLYHDSLKATHKIAAAANIDISISDSIATAVLTRAALELPCPKDIYKGIDPSRTVPQWKVLALTALYKVKITLTNAIAKVLISRVLLRGVARGWLEFIAVPVTALWNAFIATKIMREVKLRAIGPAQLDQLIPPLLENTSANLIEVAERAIACSATASLQLHPNLLYMLSLVDKKLGSKKLENIDSVDKFIEAYKGLDFPEQSIALKILVISSIVDTRYTSKELKLLSLCHPDINLDKVPVIKQSFLRGKPCSDLLNQLS